MAMGLFPRERSANVALITLPGSPLGPSGASIRVRGPARVESMEKSWDLDTGETAYFDVVDAGGLGPVAQRVWRKSDA
jgi:hypothetical protein